MKTPDTATQPTDGLGAKSGDALGIAQSYLTSRAGDLGLSAADIAELDALALPARDDLTVRTSRTVWLARKPAG